MEISFLVSRLEVLAISLAKGKVPVTIWRYQRRRKPPGKGMPTPGNHEVGFVATGNPTRVQKGIISRAPSSLPCIRRIPWPRNLFSPPNIPQVDGVVSFISEKGLDIRASTPSAAPLVQHECSRFTPLASIQQLHPTLRPTSRQPVSNKPTPFPPRSQFLHSLREDFNFALL